MGGELPQKRFCPKFAGCTHHLVVNSLTLVVVVSLHRNGPDRGFVAETLILDLYNDSAGCGNHFQTPEPLVLKHAGLEAGPVRLCA